MDPNENQHRQREESRQREFERENAKETERPEPHKIGIMSAVDAVRDIDFPKSFDDLKDTAGGREVRTSGKHKYPLSSILDRVGEQLNEHDPVSADGRIPSLMDFQQVMQRHWGAVQWMEVPEEQRPEQGGLQPQDRGSGQEWQSK